jgi:hypothetical protein
LTGRPNGPTTDQTCNAAVILDFSKHINKILDLDFDTRRARVQPGVILDTLRNADGLVAFISQRKSNGSITIAVMKEFERDGSMHRTQFISELLFESYLDMVKRAIDRARQLRDEGLVPTKSHAGPK